MRNVLLLLFSLGLSNPTLGAEHGTRSPADVRSPQRRPLGAITYSLASSPALATVVGTPSAEVLLSVNGSSLTGNITVTAPAGFELGLSSTGPYAASQSIVPQSGGFVNNAAVFVRLTGASAGTLSGNIALSSSGSTTVDVPVTGLVATSANPRATLSSISPTTAMPGTITLHFYGSNFVPGAEASIYMSPLFTVGPTTFVSSSHLTAPVSVRGVNSPVTTYCQVSNPVPGGGGTTPPGVISFTAVPGPPAITSFSPTIGPVGTLVTINGAGFVETGPDAVYFNGVQAPLHFSPSHNQLTVRVPPGATTGPITVTTTGGSFTTTTPFVVPPDFFEDFETGTKTSYVPASVPLFTGGWTLAEALIGTTAGVDKFNGTRAARLRGGGFVEMDVDKPNGAGVVTVSAASYATETGASFIPEISTDGGITYTSLLGSSPAPALTSVLTQYSFTANRTGNVRLRFSSTNTAATTNPRINLDDIGITSYGLGTGTQAGLALPALQVYPVPAHDQLTITGVEGSTQVALYDLLGRPALAPATLPASRTLALPATLPAGIYLLHVATRDGQRMVRITKK